jgi:hypothetical protein
VRILADRNWAMGGRGGGTGTCNRCLHWDTRAHRKKPHGVRQLGQGDSEDTVNGTKAHSLCSTAAWAYKEA